MSFILQASGGKGGAVHVWDAETNAHIHKFTGHRDTVSVSMHNNYVVYLKFSGFVAFGNHYNLRVLILNVVCLCVWERTSFAFSKPKR